MRERGQSAVLTAAVEDAAQLLHAIDSDVCILARTNHWHGDASDTSYQVGVVIWWVNGGD